LIHFYKRMFRVLACALLQLAGVASFAWAMHYQMYRIDLPEKLAPNRAKFGGVWKYLTFLNMVLQCIFFIIAFLANFSKKFVKTRDVMFASAAFPIGIFVAVIFWGLYFVDRKLIFPKELDAFFPAILNHCMHSTVVPLQLGQMLLVRHRYPTRRTGAALTAILCLAYLVWINYIYYATGHWVYPVFRVLSPLARGAFMLFCSLMGGGLYLAGEAVNTVVWGARQTKRE